MTQCRPPGTNVHDAMCRQSHSHNVFFAARFNENQWKSTKIKENHRNSKTFLVLVNILTIFAMYCNAWVHILTIFTMIFLVLVHLLAIFTMFRAPEFMFCQYLQYFLHPCCIILNLLGLILKSILNAFIYIFL